MPPMPAPDETMDDWMARCVPMVIDDGAAEDGEQAGAVCRRIWEEHHAEAVAAKFSRHRLVVLDGELAGAPAEFRLFRFGLNETIDGEFLVDEEAMTQIVAAFAAYGNNLVIDYEHQTLEPMEAPAAGWITRLINKGPDGLWAAVNWTERAAAYLQSRQYRYFSPVFFATTAEPRRIVELHSVALTNKPKTLHMEPLVAKDAPARRNPSPSPGEETMKKIAELLTLKADADEAAVLAAIKGLQSKAEQAAAAAANAAVLEALGLKAGATQSEVVATIHALKQSATQAVKPEEVQALKDRLAKRDADDLVAAAMKAGKIAPAQKDWADTYALKDPEGFKLFVEKAAPVVPLTREHGEGDKPAGSALDATQLAINKMLGVSDEVFKKYHGGTTATA